MKPYEDKCPECDGDGVVMCDCCDSEKDCEICNGEGIDPAALDLDKFNEAARTLFHGNSPDGTWELIENKIWVGRTNGKANIYYRDFRYANA